MRIFCILTTREVVMSEAIEVRYGRVWGKLNNRIFWINFNKQNNTVSLPAIADIDSSGIVDLKEMLDAAVNQIRAN